MSSVGNIQIQDPNERPTTKVEPTFVDRKEGEATIIGLPFENKNFDPSVIDELNNAREKALNKAHELAAKIPGAQEILKDGALETAAMSAIAGEEFIKKEIDEIKDIFSVVGNKDDKTIEEKVQDLGLPKLEASKVMLYARSHFPRYLEAVKKRDLSEIAKVDYEIITNLLKQPELANQDPAKVLQAFFLYTSELTKGDGFLSTLTKDVTRKINVGIATFTDYVGSLFADNPSAEMAATKAKAKEIASTTLEQSFMDTVSHTTATGGKEEFAENLGSAAAHQATAFLKFTELAKNLGEQDLQGAYKEFYKEMVFGPLKILLRPSSWSKLITAATNSVEAKEAAKAEEVAKQVTPKVEKEATKVAS